MQKKPKKMMFVSVSPIDNWCGTGHLADELVKRLSRVYEVYCVSWGNIGQYSHAQIVECGERWWEWADRIEPDVIFLSHDVWMFEGVEYLRARHPGVIIVGYFPIDTDTINRKWIEIMQNCDLVITPSQFGRRAILRRAPEINVAVVPEGVSEKEYYVSIQEKDIYKQKVFGTSEVFVCTFYGMNQFKKNPAVMLDAFTLFSRNKEDVRLFLSLICKKQKVHGIEIIADLDIKDMYEWRWILDKVLVNYAIMPREKVVELLKITDVILFPSQGEGFGLPVVEGMMAGAIPILSCYSAHIELPEFYFPVGYVLHRAYWNANRAIVDKISLAHMLENAYHLWKEHREVWREKQIANQSKAIRCYNWDQNVSKIISLIEQVASGIKRTKNYFEVWRLK